MSEATGRRRRGPGSRPGAAPGASLSPAPSRPVHRPAGEGRRALPGRGRSEAASCELGFLFWGELGRLGGEKRRGRREGAAAANFSLG